MSVDIITAASLWAASTKKNGIVIPYSICWRDDGRCVMGKGIALQAARRWPAVQHELGALCKKAKNHTPVVARRVKKWCSHLFLLPIRPLDETLPHRGWMGPIDPNLISIKLDALQQYINALKKKSPDKLPTDKINIPTLEDELPEDESALFIHLVETRLSPADFSLIRTAKGTFTEKGA